MLPTSENYEKVFQDCQIDIKECEKEISRKEEEIEELKVQKQGFLELREALTKILGSTNSESLHISDVPFPAPPPIPHSKNSESFFAVETPKGLIEIPADAFKNSIKIVDATIKFLRIVNQPQKTPDIVYALSKGGFESKSAFFSENVRSNLRSASKSSKSEIIWKDNYWQLKEWFSIYNSTLKPTEIAEQNKRKVGVIKWSKSIGDAAQDILKNEKNGLHLEEIHKRLANEGIYPTIGSLDAALRQDGKKRFELVNARTYRLVKKT